MSEIRALIEQLVSAGVDPIEAAEVVSRAVIHGASNAPKQRSAGAVRQERYRRQLDVSPDEWERLRVATFERDRFVCVYCGDDVLKDPQCDHIYPLALGGSSDPSNLATSCKACNSSKRDRPAHEWFARLL